MLRFNMLHTLKKHCDIYLLKGHCITKEPCNICSGRISICMTCYGVFIDNDSSSLTTECCGKKLTKEQHEAIVAKEIDYIGGRWVKHRVYETDNHPSTK